MQQLVVLSVKMKFFGSEDVVHPVVLMDSQYRVLVDCGPVGALERIEEALRAHQIEPSSITHIILTHQDHDHVGCAAAFKRRYPPVRILCSEEEKPYIEGSKVSLRLEQALAMQAQLPEAQKSFGEAFCALLRSVEPVAVDQVIHIGQHLPFCGGTEVIGTAGHTPGHLSLSIEKFGIIIAGDAIALEAGKPVIANPQFTLDPDKAEASLQYVLSLGAQKLICYHGGILDLR
ncbi:MAG: MBL fold metallo-hydrolase [Sphaerochaeta sp.]|nr:MBL fold metallo-hydrolase [Sphaerochaeta sp.]